MSKTQKAIGDVALQAKPVYTIALRPWRISRSVYEAVVLMDGHVIFRRTAAMNDIPSVRAALEMCAEERRRRVKRCAVR